MIRLFSLSVAFVSILSLVGSSRLSAGAGNTYSTTPATAAVRAIPVAATADSSPILTVAAQQIFLFGGDSKNNDKGLRGNSNGAKFTEGPENVNGVDPDDDPSPSPEPSTLLSFGTALLIGAGVLYSRRRFGTKAKK